MKSSIYLFQITIASTHDVNRGLVDVASKYHFPPNQKWRFVFLILPNMILVVPQLRKGTLRDLVLYSAVIDPEVSGAP